MCEEGIGRFPSDRWVNVMLLESNDGVCNDGVPGGGRGIAAVVYQAGKRGRH